MNNPVIKDTELITIFSAEEMTKTQSVSSSKINSNCKIAIDSPKIDINSSSTKIAESVFLPEDVTLELQLNSIPHYKDIATHRSQFRKRGLITTIQFR